jgi:nicotinamidase-related amidase
MADATIDGRGALLLIDFQEDFLAPKGRMPVDQGQVLPVLEAAHRAVEEAQLVEDLIVKIGNEFKPSDKVGNLFRHHAAMKDSQGAAWDNRIDPPGSTYLPKWRADAFCNPDLVALLEERGLSVQVIGQATACSSDRSRQVALGKLRRIGIVVV